MGDEDSNWSTHRATVLDSDPSSERETKQNQISNNIFSQFSSVSFFLVQDVSHATPASSSS